MKSTMTVEPAPVTKPDLSDPKVREERREAMEKQVESETARRRRRRRMAR